MSPITTLPGKGKKRNSSTNKVHSEGNKAGKIIKPIGKKLRKTVVEDISLKLFISKDKEKDNNSTYKSLLNTPRYRYCDYKKSYDKRMGLIGSFRPAYSDNKREWRIPDLSALGIKWDKNLNPAIAGVLCGCILLFGGFHIGRNAVAAIEINESLMRAWIVRLEGYDIGIVEDSRAVQSIIDDIITDFKDNYEMDVVLNQEIIFEEVYTDDRHLSSLNDIERVIRNNVDAQVEAYVISVDGIDRAVLKSESDARALLDRIMEPYINIDEDKNGQIEDIGFVEKVSINSQTVDYSSVQRGDEVYEYLTTAKEKEEVYEVEDGDSLWLIAYNHDMSVDDIVLANPELKESQVIKPGQELNLVVPEYTINVKTVEIVEYKETIDFETETRKDESMYKGQTKTIRNGEPGEMDVVARVFKHNGIEKDREILSEKVISEPVNEIVAEGTRKPPANVVVSRGTGSMIWPTKGRITSGFGPRWGRMHNGIDIANSTGTPIYAADSGTVDFSGWSGGYGNLIRISHGNGIVTYYAHLSSRNVREGQRVQKGSLIGHMGSTGNSTGPHLHFEVRVNGKPVNPRGYLR